MDRRDFLLTSTALLVGASTLRAGEGGTDAMYGLIGKMIAVDGRREELARILLEGTRNMPGCLSYIVALDTEDQNALWITEVWDSESAHQASLTLPSVQAAIEKGRPLIAGFEARTVTTPLGGHGLAR